MLTSPSMAAREAGTFAKKNGARERNNIKKTLQLCCSFRCERASNARQENLTPQLSNSKLIGNLCIFTRLFITLFNWYHSLKFWFSIGKITQLWLDISWRTRRRLVWICFLLFCRHRYLPPHLLAQFLLHCCWQDQGGGENRKGEHLRRLQFPHFPSLGSPVKILSCNPE